MKPTYVDYIKDASFGIGAVWDKLALDKDTAVDFAHEHINEEPEQMIDIYHYSMEYCLAHSGASVNERYRQNRQDEIDLKISEMVAQHTTDTDLVLYRGVCDYVYNLMKENAKDISSQGQYKLEQDAIKENQKQEAIKEEEEQKTQEEENNQQNNQSGNTQDGTIQENTGDVIQMPSNQQSQPGQVHQPQQQPQV